MVYYVPIAIKRLINHSHNVNCFGHYVWICILLLIGCGRL